MLSGMLLSPKFAFHNFFTMKKLLLISSAIFILAGCKSSDKKQDTGIGSTDKVLTDEEKQQALADSSNFTTIEWIDPPVRNLGQLVKGQSIEITFRFKNTGTKNLVIQDVTAGCGCTIPEKPEKPFAPGEEGIIRAKFDGSGHGTISKNITVKANTTPAADHILTFQGEIKE